MFIRDYEEGIVTYETYESAVSLRNCLPLLEGYEEGFQGLPESRDGKYALAIYDRNLIKVGWVCEA